MSARIYWPSAWSHAREHRARSGKAPRLAVRRSIVLRQGPEGDWSAGVFEWRFGAWKKPNWLCGRVALAEARAAALAEWEKHKLPLLWSYYGEGVRPFYEGLNEPKAARS